VESVGGATNKAFNTCSLKLTTASKTQLIGHHRQGEQDNDNEDTIHEGFFLEVKKGASDSLRLRPFEARRLQ
jgi:hypothetical protein